MSPARGYPGGGSAEEMGPPRQIGTTGVPATRVPSCRTETVEVDGVQVVALVRGDEPFDADARAAFTEVYRAARHRHHVRTPLVALPTRYSLARMLREHIATSVERIAAGRAVHEAMLAETWVLADLAGRLEPGDEVEVRIDPRTPLKVGRVVERAGRLIVELEGSAGG